jgi:polyribonucleotide nucleotidyltransferase
VLVKVLSVEGNRIKLSRKAILKEQRAKMAAEGGEPAPDGAAGAVTFEGGHEKADEPSSEQNFNRDGERREHAGTRHDGGHHGGGGGRGGRGGPGGGRGGDRGRGRGGPRR